MTTSATTIVSATDNTNRHNYNNNNNNNNNNSSDASNINYKISNNNNNNNNEIIDKNTSCTGNNEYVAIKTQIQTTPVEQQQQHQHSDLSIKHESTLLIPNTTTTTTTTKLSTNMVQNGIMNLTTTSSSSLSSTASNNTRAMQSDEDFNIRFVNLVRLHKCLYDKKVPEYRNRDNQEKAWSLISQETRESVIHCKERWRNLRACLSRYIKQQSGSDPQHKPYYLTEHMAFLLPFLKSTRSGGTMNYSLELHQQLTNNNSSQQSNNLSALFPISAAGTVNPLHLSAMTVIPIPNRTLATNGVEIKHSLSENDDEETIDAFDPAVNGTLQKQQEEAINLHYQQQQQQRISPTLSDTASANSLQHYIPDVQLSEAPSSEYNHHNVTSVVHVQQHDTAKRIKLECDGNNSMNARICGCGLDNTVSSNNPDMEFFRSILPDIAFLSAQQKRKLKIGILELIDDVVARYPQATTVTTSTTTPVTNHLNGRQRNTIDRRK